MEGRSGLLELLAQRVIELAPQAEEELRDLASSVELVRDAVEDTAVLPERARLGGTAFRVSLRDQLNRAERTVRLGVHTGTVGEDASPLIGIHPESRCGNVRMPDRSRASMIEA